MYMLIDLGYLPGSIYNRLLLNIVHKKMFKTKYVLMDYHKINCLTGQELKN